MLLAGAGKTKLSSKVVDDARNRLSDPQNQETLAYFYCDANRSSHSSSLAILRGLVKQLSTPLQAADDRSILQAVADIYRTNQARGFPSNGLTIEDCGDILPALVNAYPQVTLVVDGLDECPRDDRHTLIVVLDKLLASTDGLLKIFIASRNDTDLAEHYHRGRHIAVSGSDNGEDIYRYVKFRMEQDTWCHKHMSKAVRDQVLATFKRKSQDMLVTPRVPPRMMIICVGECN
jgi:hypothetical protein